MKAIVNQNSFFRWHQNYDAENKYGQYTTNVTESTRYFLEIDAARRSPMEMKKKNVQTRRLYLLYEFIFVSFPLTCACTQENRRKRKSNDAIAFLLEYARMQVNRST